MRRARLTLALLSAACSGGVSVVAPPPLDPGVQTLLVAFESDTEFEVHVAKVTDGALSPASLQSSKAFELGSELHLTALRYLDPPEALGMNEGPFASVTGTRAAALPEADAPILELALSAGDDASDWRVIDRLGSRLAELRVAPPRGRCADFAAETRALGGLAPPTFVQRVEPELALLGTDNDSFYSISRDTSARVDTSVRSDYQSLFVTRAGTLWLGSEFGLLDRAHLRPSLELDGRTFTQSGGAILWISGDPDAETPDLFTMSIEGVVEHFDGERSQIVYVASGGHTDLNTGGVAWVAREEAVAVWPNDLGVTRIKRAPSGEWNLTREDTPGARAAFISASSHPTLGPIVANSEGQFYVREAGAWRELEGSPTRLFIFDLTPYGDGFVYGAAFGNMGQYVPGQGFCPLQRFVIADDVRRIAALDSGAVILIGRGSTSTPYFAWLEPR